VILYLRVCEDDPTSVCCDPRIGGGWPGPPVAGETHMPVRDAL